MSDKNMGITVTGDISDVSQALNDLIDLITNIPDKIIDISTNIDDADIKTLESDLAAIPDKTVDVSTTVDDTELKTLETELDDLPTDKSVDVSVDASGTEEASSQLDDTSQSADDVGTSGALAGAGMAAGVGELIDAAGNYQDQMTRIGTTQDGLNESTDTIASKWGSVMGQMSDDTGRTGGDVRKDLADMGVVGVHSTDTIEQGFGLMSGAAFNTGNDIGTVEQAYAKVVQSGTLGNKQLKTLGLDADDIFKRTGLTMDQVKAQMKGMNAEQRAAFLNMLMNSDKNRAGIEAFKESWQHTKDEVGASIQFIARILGALLLPVATVVLGGVISVLEWVANAIEGLNGPVGTAAKFVMGLVLAFGFIIGAAATLMFAYESLGIKQILFNARTILSTTLQYAQRAAMVLSALATDGLSGAMAVLNGTTLQAIGEADAYSGSIEANNVVTNEGIIAKARAGAETLLLAARTAVVTGATELYSAATSGSILKTVGAGASRLALAGYSIIAAGATGVLSAATAVLDAIMDANPIMLVVLAIIALIAALTWAYYNIKPVHDAIDFLWELIKGFWAWMTGGAAGGDIWGWLIAGLQGIWNFITGIIGGIVSLVDGFISLITGGGSGGKGGGMWDWIWKGLQTALWVIFPIPMLIINVIQMLIDWLTGRPNTLFKWITDSINKAWFDLNVIWMRIYVFLMNQILKIEKLPANLFKWVTDSLNKVWFDLNVIWSRIYVFVMNTVNKIKAIPGDLFDWVILSIAKAYLAVEWQWNHLIGMVQMDIALIKAIPGEIWDWLTGGVKSAIDKVFAFWKSLTDYLQALPDNMKKWGSDIILGLINGIVNAIPGLKGALSAIGINFPQSQPKSGPLSVITPGGFEDWGNMLVGGLSKGVNGGIDTLNKALGSVSATPNPSSLGLSSGAMSAISSPGTGKTENNIYIDLKLPNGTTPKEAQEYGDKVGGGLGANPVLQGLLQDGGKPRVIIRK